MPRDIAVEKNSRIKSRRVARGYSHRKVNRRAGYPVEAVVVQHNIEIRSKIYCASTTQNASRDRSQRAGAVRNLVLYRSEVI